MSAPAGTRIVELLGYRIHVGPWLLDEVGRIARAAAPAHVYAIITDENVGPVAAASVVASIRHHVPEARVILQGIVPGEASKTRETWLALTDWLLEQRCGRDTTVIALGGGVVGDLAGFVAATFMRGVPFVQVPTSLLAMVDASVGGKVGVDTVHGKNLVGAFHQPAAVVIDPMVLQTLPREEFRNGLSEVLKHGVIADAGYFDRASNLAARLLASDAVSIAWDGAELSDLLHRSVEIKAQVVTADPREAPGGIRQSLNFGHTIAHAIEACLDFAMPHGHAVSIGMVLEAEIAARLALAPHSVAERIRATLSRLGLPTALPEQLSPSAVAASATRDKKARGGVIVMALPAALGTVATTAVGYGARVESGLLEAALTASRRTA